MQTLIQEQKDKVQDHKNGQLAHLKTNLFVESGLADIVETNLNNIIQELSVMKIEVEKIKSYYDSIK